MTRYIMKPERDRDLYVEISTIVDTIVRYGTREQFLEDPEVKEERLDRADELGSEISFGTWDEDNIMWNQYGTLPRNKIADAVEVYECYPFAPLDDPRFLALLDPFED